MNDEEKKKKRSIERGILVFLLGAAAGTRVPCARVYVP